MNFAATQMGSCLRQKLAQPILLGKTPMLSYGATARTWDKQII
jgi:hypothetical protein